MTLIRRLMATWGQDRLLGRVVRNSGYLFSSNIISAILSILTANLLGVEQFGALGIVISFVSSVNRLLSFRMGDVVVRYMGDFLARDEKEKAAAIVKAAALTETATSLIAFGLLIVLAPLGAAYIIHDPASTPLVILYGISILGMFATETATGVLQVGGYFPQSIGDQSHSGARDGSGDHVCLFHPIGHSGGLICLPDWEADRRYRTDHPCCQTNDELTQTGLVACFFSASTTSEEFIPVCS